MLRSYSRISWHRFFTVLIIQIHDFEIAIKLHFRLCFVPAWWFPRLRAVIHQAWLIWVFWFSRKSFWIFSACLFFFWDCIAMRQMTTTNFPLWLPVPLLPIMVWFKGSASFMPKIGVPATESKPNQRNNRESQIQRNSQHRKHFSLLFAQVFEVHSLYS